MALQAAQTAYKIPRTPTQKLHLRQAMAAYANLCEAHESVIHYSWARPTQIGASPVTGFTTDCSGYFINAAYNAWHKTGIFIPDPGGFNYNGDGNTDSILAHNYVHKAPQGKYMIGDFVLYGTWEKTHHIMWCKKAGTSLTSLWSSHGEESGPEQRRLSDDKRAHVGIFRLAVLT